MCVLHYTSACIRGGSCEVCRDWSEEMWSVSDAQRDKRLAKLLEKRSSKKAKVSVKGTPSSKISKPSKTVNSPQLESKQVEAKKQGLRKGYQDTVDRILNLGNLYAKNVHNHDVIMSKFNVIFPLTGRFTSIEHFSLPAYISGGLSSRDASGSSQPSRVVDRQLPPMVKQSYGATATVTSDHQQGHENMGEYTLETEGQEYNHADGNVLDPAPTHLDSLHTGSVGVHPHATARGLPRPLPTPTATVTEPDYPATGRDSDTGSLSPPLPLEPWSAGSPTGDRR